MNKNFKKKMKKYDEGEIPSGKSKSGKRRKQYDGIGPEGMPDEFFSDKEVRDSSGRLIANEGDFNLSQVKGEQARTYFEMRLGIPMPPGVSRVIPHIE